MLSSPKIRDSSLQALVTELETALSGFEVPLARRALAQLSAAVGSRCSPEAADMGTRQEGLALEPWETYLVMAGVVGHHNLSSRADLDEAEPVLKSLRKQLIDLVPGVALGRVGHGRIEFSLEAVDEADLCRRLESLQGAPLRAIGGWRALAQSPTRRDPRLPPPCRRARPYSRRRLHYETPRRAGAPSRSTPKISELERRNGFRSPAICGML